MAEKPPHVLVLTVEGKRFVYATCLRGRDPMEMTLAEWREAPVLSAVAMSQMIGRVRPGDAGETK